MPTSAAGSRKTPTLRRCAGGFTLLELLLVVALMALVAAGASLALRDSATSRLETEALRLAAPLDAARAQSRTLGVAVQWRSQPGGFAWQGLPSTGQDALPTAWLNATTTVVADAPLVLGPEPVIAPRSVQLSMADAPAARVRIATDGVRPFALVPGKAQEP